MPAKEAPIIRRSVDKALAKPIDKKKKGLVGFALAQCWGWEPSPNGDKLYLDESGVRLASSKQED